MTYRLYNWFANGGSIITSEHGRRYNVQPLEITDTNGYVKSLITDIQTKEQYISEGSIELNEDVIITMWSQDNVYRTKHIIVDIYPRDTGNVDIKIV